MLEINILYLISYISVNATLTAFLGGYFLKVSNLVLDKQQMDGSMRNCNMPFSAKK